MKDKPMLQDREKFWAFLALLGTICFITLPTLLQDVSDTKLTLADKVIVGLIGVLGTVAGALFQAGQNRIEEKRLERDTKQAETLNKALATAPTNGHGTEKEPLHAELVNKEPIPVVDVDATPAGSGVADKPIWEGQ